MYIYIYIYKTNSNSLTVTHLLRAYGVQAGKKKKAALPMGHLLLSSDWLKKWNTGRYF